MNRLIPILAMLLMVAPATCFASGQAPDFPAEEAFVEETTRPSCAICRTEYEEGDKIITHSCPDGSFHMACMQAWLLKKEGQADGEPPLCPACTQELEQDQQIALVTASPQPITAHHVIVFNPWELRLIRFTNRMAEAAASHTTSVVTLAGIIIVASGYNITGNS